MEYLSMIMNLICATSGHLLVRNLLLVLLFLNMSIQKYTCSQIWRTIPDIGPQMCSVECFRYNGNCKDIEYDYHHLTCNLMEEDVSDTGTSKLTSLLVDELPFSIQNVVEGCSNITCHSFYICDVTSKTNIATCSEMNCPVGHYRANNDCLPCGPGYRQKDEGQYHCNICPSGTYNPYWGNRFCYHCPQGYHQPGTGQTGCLKCDVGYHQDKTRQVFCKECGEGHFADEPGMAECEECPPGYKQPNTGENHCKVCKEGTYQDIPGQPHCKKCPIGTYQDEKGKDTCKSCPSAIVEESTVCYTPGY